MARRALLDADASNQAFVYRLAVRFPEGPNRRDILDEIAAKNLVDNAATYLSKQIRYDATLMIKGRTADVLGDSVRMRLELPAIAMMFKSSIEQSIRGEVQACLK